MIVDLGDIYHEQVTQKFRLQVQPKWIYFFVKVTDHQWKVVSVALRPTIYAIYARFTLGTTTTIEYYQVCDVVITDVCERIDATSGHTSYKKNKNTACVALILVAIANERRW